MDNSVSKITPLAPADNTDPASMTSWKMANGSYPSGAPVLSPHQNVYPAVNPDMNSAFRAMYPMSKDFLVGKAASRRMKRMVPNEHKDDRYWEKRKRNNDAARRSRENKRHVEMGMRARTIFLEEEIALLRKEVSVLKTKFSLNPETRYFAIDSNGELVPTSASAAFNSIEEVITKELQAKFIGEYTPSESSASSHTPSISSSADMEGSSGDDYVPMKKRRRPKLEAELSYSTGSSAASMSPSESVGTSHYPSTVAQTTEDCVYHSAEQITHSEQMDRMKTDSVTRSYSPECQATVTSSTSNSVPSREQYASYSMSRGPHHNDMNYNTDVYSSVSMGAYPTKLPSVHYPRMLSPHPEDPNEHQASLSPLSPRSQIASEAEDSNTHRENVEIRSQLQQLSAEVARMKNFMRQPKPDDSC